MKLRLNGTAGAGAILKKIALAVTFSMLALPQASASTTKEGYVACVQKESLDNYIRFLTNKDEASINAYIDSWKCFYLKGRMTATVTDSPGVFGTTVGFVVKGVKMWALREAIKY